MEFSLVLSQHLYNLLTADTSASGIISIGISLPARLNLKNNEHTIHLHHDSCHVCMFQWFNNHEQPCSELVKSQVDGKSLVHHKLATTTVTSLRFSNVWYITLSSVAKIHLACSCSPHNFLHSPSLRACKVMNCSFSIFFYSQLAFLVCLAQTEVNSLSLLA